MSHSLELQRGSTFGNKLCKIFSRYEFLVQLVFAPRFNQRHIPRYNYIKRQQQKKPTWNRPVNAAHVLKAKNCEVLLFPTAGKPFDRKGKCPTGRGSFRVKFPTVRISLTRVKYPGIAPGGGGVMGGFGIDSVYIRNEDNKMNTDSRHFRKGTWLFRST